jgi:hypothetical protein
MAERRIGVDELVEESTVFGGHLEIEVAATPWINVASGEVGPNASERGRPQCPTGGWNPGAIPRLSNGGTAT